MLEKIYTIPVNEAFDSCAIPADAATDEQRRASAAAHAANGCGCPFCRLNQTLEENELEIILGASMMEPDVRIRTNEMGFCRSHYDLMFHRRNRLGMALILESHLDSLRSDMRGKPLGNLLHGRDGAATERIETLEKSCYICDRVNASMAKMVENAVYLWESEREFRDKLSAQPYFCLPHYRMLLQCAREKLPKKAFPEFREALTAVVEGYFDALRSDTSQFIKKFDYRYEEEPWGNSRDAVERAMKFLCGDPHKPNGK